MNDTTVSVYLCWIILRVISSDKIPAAEAEHSAINKALYFAATDTGTPQRPLCGDFALKLCKLSN